MRAYIIKRTGKTHLGNMVFNSLLTFNDDTEIYAGIIFFRMKDAKKYLSTFEYKKFFEVVGVTIDNSKKDNRLRYSPKNTKYSKKEK